MVLPGNRRKLRERSPLGHAFIPSLEHISEGAIFYRNIVSKIHVLAEYVVSSIVPLPYRGSIGGIHEAFWLPNIYSLSICNFHDSDACELPDESQVGKSPVKALNLIDCGAREEALASVFSWPAALEKLHYDANQDERNFYYGYTNDLVRSWTCAAFVRALQPQKATLKKLTLTRTESDSKGLGDGPRIDLREFTALRTLRTHYTFIHGTDDQHEAWKSFPCSLEMLEVHYDDQLYSYLDEDDNFQFDKYAEFPLELIRHKKAYLPKLSKMTLTSVESLWDDTNEENFPPGCWTPPPSLAEKFESAGVELTVWIGYEDTPDFENLIIPPAIIDSPRKRRRFE